MSARIDNSKGRFGRMKMLVGGEAAERLQKARVAVFGIGGVGGYVVEALARSGVGAFDLIDSDRVAESNINRQIIALSSTIGRYKTDVMKERILEINPLAKVQVFHCFFLPENKDLFDFSCYSYVADAVDTVTAKIELVMQAQKYHVPVISSMGTGNKLNPAGFEVADIYGASVCPLARVMRRELKKRGVESLKVVYSREEPVAPGIKKGELPFEEKPSGKDPAEEELFGKKTPSPRPVPGSVSFVPPVAGMIMAGEIIKDLMKG